ncbi:MAG: hypothetical protein IBX55_01290 [Methyloprofundus sp.]|nr:hypothetical protein [Methyloprofundus sp.]
MSDEFVNNPIEEDEDQPINFLELHPLLSAVLQSGEYFSNVKTKGDLELLDVDLSSGHEGVIWIDGEDYTVMTDEQADKAFDRYAESLYKEVIKPCREGFPESLNRAIQSGNSEIEQALRDWFREDYEDIHAQMKESDSSDEDLYINELHETLCAENYMEPIEDFDNIEAEPDRDDEEYESLTDEEFEEAQSLYEERKTNHIQSQKDLIESEIDDYAEKRIVALADDLDDPVEEFKWRFGDTEILKSVLNHELGESKIDEILIEQTKEDLRPDGRGRMNNYDNLEAEVCLTYISDDQGTLDSVYLYVYKSHLSGYFDDDDNFDFLHYENIKNCFLESAKVDDYRNEVMNDLDFEVMPRSG